VIDFLTLDSWVTSDQHWGHDNIIRFQGRPQSHEALMRRQWESRVQPDDVVLHLGDLVCFEYRQEYRDKNYWAEYVAELPGQKFIILGNHDDHSPAWYGAAGFTVLGRGNTPFFWHRPDNGALVAFSHEPVEDCGGWSMNVHGHTHGNTHRPLPSDRAYRNVQRRNVCVEVTNYAPVRVRSVLDSPA
jgi:calcineurin-like phosphoesterase family protein